MYQEILLAVALQRWQEFTPHALAAREAAVTLAKGSEAKLSVLSVYEYGKIEEPGLPLEEGARYREDQLSRIDAMMEAKMKVFLAEVGGMGIPITAILKTGEPRKMIVAMTQTLRADLLVLGAHSKRSVFDAILGGTASYVSRHAPCPVLMVKP